MDTELTRRLVLLRHAKSDWPDVADHERPLAKRGRRDAPVVGRWLGRSGYVPDVVVCSTARRARETWELTAAGLADAVRGAAPPVRYEPRVYEATVLGLLMLVRELPDDQHTVLMVGHNPGIAELVVGLTAPPPQPPSAFPTASVAVLGLAGNWAETGPEEARLLAFAVPADMRLRPDYLPDLGRYLLVFACGDPEGAHWRPVRADLPVVARAGTVPGAGVALVVDLDTEEAEAGGGAGPDLRGVLAHAAGEHDDVEPVHRRRHRRDEPAEPVQVDIAAEHRPRIAGRGTFEHFPHVARAGQAGQPGAVLQRRAELARRGVRVLLQPEHQARVHRPRPGGHDEPVEGGEAHGGVHRLAGLDGRREA